MASGDGSIEFKTDLDNSDLEKQLKDAESKIKSLKRSIERENMNKSFIEKEMDRAEISIRETESELDRLRERYEKLSSLQFSDPQAYSDAQPQMESIAAKISEQESLLAKQIKRQDTLNEKYQVANDHVEVFSERLEKVQARYAELSAQAAASAKEQESAYQSATARIKSKFQELAANARTSMEGAANSASRAWQSFGNRIGTMVKKVFFFGLILQGLRSIKNSLVEALSQNLQFSASLASLRASMQGFAAGIAQYVAPAIAAAVGFAAKAITYLAQLVDNIFGTGIVRAIQQAQAAAQATWRQTDASKAAQEAAEKAAKAAAKQGKTAKKLAKEEDKAAKSILAFDELNVLQAENAEDAADALDDQGDAVGGVDYPDPGSLMNPNWDALDVGKIDAKLAEITLILGAALMAVGAILAFSGINIPLGLTLMAIGALMVYTAYKEQWDVLPAQVQEAITNALVITGTVLLVIGAVLAFSGINIALGIGLMAAGAILLGTAAALNWETMSTELQTAITAAMVVLGTAALVVGAILAFSGTNVSLGIGLMLLGAGALGGAAALNWEYISSHLEEVIAGVEAVLGAALLVIGAVLTFAFANLPLGIGLMAAGAVVLAKALTVDWDAMPEQMRQSIAVIESVVAPALLVIGMILTVTTGPSPLSIGLIAAGALMLVHLATLNWNQMPDDTRTFVTTMLGIVGTALLVLGIILVATGFAAPLGIALIAAGAMSLIAAAAINWDFIVDKVKEILGKIKDFWNTNIAPVFTWEWWANLFKSIVNGLIMQINNGLNAFGSFINELAGGVSDILNFFGVEGWSFSIGMPQIPYLAQGAVIPPNREFMAVLGDQQHGNNIETPESLMRQVVREEAGQMIADAIAAMLGGNGGNAPDVVLMVGRKELARETLRGVRELQDTGELGMSGLLFT
jgi:hypothetical protein